MNHPDLENVLPNLENVFPDVFPNATRQEPDPLSLPPDATLRRDLRKCLLALPYRAFLLAIVEILECRGCQNVHLLGREGFIGRNRAGGWDLEATLPPSQSFADGQHGVRCIIQAKQFDDLAVQQRTVDELRGCCLRAGAGQGLLITTSRFSPVAQRAAGASALAPVTLIDGERLLDLLTWRKLGVTQSRRGKWQIDAEFLQSLREKAVAPAATRVERRKAKRPKVSPQPREARAGATAPSENRQPIILHFSITLDSGAGETLRGTKKQ